MSVVLSYGFKKPQNGDKGSSFFPDLEFDIQQLNDHTHDGVTSAQVLSTSIASVQQSIPSSGWVATSGGTYRQLVTVPNSKDYDNSIIMFRKDSTEKEQMLLKVEKVSAKTYYVYINDPGVSVIAYYVS